MIQEMKKDDLKRRLHNLGYEETDGKSYLKLLHTYQHLNSLQIDVESKEEKWF